ncbi:hypothetical protein ADUPG1_007160 [Aduncisulcus paluster]|uniref:Protein kinase domain-containing protein n=1 Tax=Aduncisulcus paluster TaxID=2918883 RepID=A0ABQ5KKX4_9EUKA|nr:hypothetical protein ADUPG1_007160 [Aduncisulcus paluster]
MSIIVKNPKEFTKEGILGTGGFSTCYICSLEGIREKVCLKELKDAPDKILIDMYNEEFQKLIALTLKSEANDRIPHPIKVLNLLGHKDLSQQTYGFFTELCEGGDVSEFSKSWCGTDPLKKARLCREMISALADIQRADKHIVHRDIKPQNFLVRLESSDCKDDQCMVKGTVVVSDFGLAIARGNSISLSLTSKGNPSQIKEVKEASGDSGSVTADTSSENHHIIGTLPFMAPETAKRGVCSQRSDAFSVAMAVFAVFSDSIPFVHNPLIQRKVAEMKIDGGMEPLVETLIHLHDTKAIPQLSDCDDFLNLSDIKSDSGVTIGEQISDVFEEVFDGMSTVDVKKRMSVIAADEKLKGIDHLLPALETVISHDEYTKSTSKSSHSHLEGFFRCSSLASSFAPHMPSKPVFQSMDSSMVGKPIVDSSLLLSEELKDPSTTHEQIVAKKREQIFALKRELMDAKKRELDMLHQEQREYHEARMKYGDRDRSGDHFERKETEIHAKYSQNFHNPDYIESLRREGIVFHSKPIDHSKKFSVMEHPLCLMKCPIFFSKKSVEMSSYMSGFSLLMIRGINPQITSPRLKNLLTKFITHEEERVQVGQMLEKKMKGRDLGINPQITSPRLKNLLTKFITHEEERVQVGQMLEKKMKGRDLYSDPVFHPFQVDIHEIRTLYQVNFNALTLRSPSSSILSSPGLYHVLRGISAGIKTLRLNRTLLNPVDSKYLWWGIGGQVAESTVLKRTAEMLSYLEKSFDASGRAKCCSHIKSHEFLIIPEGESTSSRSEESSFLMDKRGVIEHFLSMSLPPKLIEDILPELFVKETQCKFPFGLKPTFATMRPLPFSAPFLHTLDLGECGMLGTPVQGIDLPDVKSELRHMSIRSDKQGISEFDELRLNPESLVPYFTHICLLVLFLPSLHTLTLSKNILSAANLCLLLAAMKTRETVLEGYLSKPKYTTGSNISPLNRDIGVLKIQCGIKKLAIQGSIPHSLAAWQCIGMMISDLPSLRELLCAIPYIRDRSSLPASFFDIIEKSLTIRRNRGYHPLQLMLPLGEKSGHITSLIEADKRSHRTSSSSSQRSHQGLGDQGLPSSPNNKTKVATCCIV